MGAGGRRNSLGEKRRCTMRRETYQHGISGIKWGIWNCQKKCFQFDIREDTPMLAVARLYQKIGDDAKKWRFEPRQLPKAPEVK